MRYGFLHLQPYRHTSISQQQYHKQFKKYYGPYLVLKKVGRYAYEIQLCVHSSIHNRFLVLARKKVVGLKFLHWS